MTTGTALASAILHRAGREQGQGSGGPERRKQVVLGLVQLIDPLPLLFFTFVFALDSFCLSVRAGKRNRKSLALTSELS